MCASHSCGLSCAHSLFDTRQISRLMNAVTAAEERQTGIEQTLDYVEQQQADLSGLLESYEAQVGDLLEGASAPGAASASGAYGGGYGGYGGARAMEVGAADAEREKA